MTTETLTTVAARTLQATVAGDVTGLTALIHPEASNREAVAEPAECRGRGPTAFAATSRWLREAWSDLAFTVGTCVAQNDLVAVHGRMSGRHTGPFTVYNAEARVEHVFPPTGRPFEVDHAHFFRMADGLVIDHWAVRDDRALGEQLGWAPPSPAYALRMTIATRRARARSGRTDH